MGVHVRRFISSMQLVPRCQPAAAAAAAVGVDDDYND
jgi:hypothetical protein